MKRMARRSKLRSGAASSFTRTFFLENWVFSTVSTNGFWRQYTPNFAQIPNSAEYGALFDTYRVNAVKMTFRPRFNGADANGGATTTVSMPYLSWYVDPKSNTNATGTYSSSTMNTFLENCNGRARSRQFTRPISVYWKPLVAVNSYTAGNPGEYKRCPWLSTANYPTVPMRLLNVFLNDNNFANTIAGWTADVYVTFYFQCKGAR